MPSGYFRIATPDDAPQLLEIYAPYVATSVSFEHEVPDVEEFRTRIEQTITIYPFIVYCEDDQVVGYAYASRPYARGSYEWLAELSIYTRQEHRGRGLGYRTYGRLINLLTLQGVRSVIAKVTWPNARSARLHERMGFELVGVLKSAGYKCESWRDVSIYQRAIGSFDGEPGPLVPFSQLDPAQVADVLAREPEIV